MKKRFLYTLFIGVLFVSNWGCTVLDEEVLDESFTGLGQADEIDGAIAPAYGQVAWAWRHTNYFGLQEIAADEAILPYRGGTDWFDGGKFLATHQHEITPGNDLVTSSWNELTTNISRAVAAIEVLRPLTDGGDTEAAGALYEMVALRAYLNMLALDSWGLAFQKESTSETSVILRGEEAISYIQTELESVVDVINTDLGPGRITQGAVWAMLARLHLNAAVYSDVYGTPDFSTEDMNKVIEYTDNILNSGRYSISPEYFDLFNDDNVNNPEIIWSLDQRGQMRNEHNRWAYWSLAGAYHPRPEYTNADGTDGPAATPDFIQTWIDAYGSEAAAEADARFFMENVIVPDSLKDLTNVTYENDSLHYYCQAKSDYNMNRGFHRGVLWGARKGNDGNFLTCGSDDIVRIYPLIQENGTLRDTTYVSHTLQVDFTNEGRLHHTGYRFAKYECSRTSNNCNRYSSVDLVMIRLGEIYLMRAEAKLRNGDATGALADVNALRAGRTARPAQTPPALTSINLETMFREYGFEMYWEGHRRTNQIRFGKFEDNWTEKTDSNPQKRLFPIPQRAIDGASNVEGFLVQNAGY